MPELDDYTDLGEQVDEPLEMDSLKVTGALSFCPLFCPYCGNKTHYETYNVGPSKTNTDTVYPVHGVLFL